MMELVDKRFKMSIINIPVELKKKMMDIIKSKQEISIRMFLWRNGNPKTEKYNSEMKIAAD